MTGSAEPLEEGPNTLAAQFTREAINRIVSVIQRERQKGTPEATIQKALASRFADYDEHSRALLYKLAAGGTIPDDFAQENISASKQPKTNTVELTVKSIPDGIKKYSLVRYLTREWMVVELHNTTLTLKSL